VAVFRDEAKLVYDGAARTCAMEGRGIDGRGALRAIASGVVSARGVETTVLRVEGGFNVTGPLARPLLVDLRAERRRLRRRIA
jgi:hypothetical protein